MVLFSNFRHERDTLGWLQCLGDKLEMYSNMAIITTGAEILSLRQEEIPLE